MDLNLLPDYLNRYSTYASLHLSPQKRYPHYYSLSTDIIVSTYYNLMIPQQMHDDNQDWRQIPKQQIEVFCSLFNKLPLPPSNPRCISLREALNQFFKAHTDGVATNRMLDRVKQLNRIEDIPKTKGRLCGGLLSKGEKAYRCYDCMTEDNSILCAKCFQLEKHIGHDFERYDVHGGCCDCGDIQKWKEQGFCSEHSQDQQVEVILGEQILNLFLEEQTYGLKLLLNMYSKFVQFVRTVNNQQWVLPSANLMIKMKKIVISKAVELVDLYGKQLIGQLVEFNKAGKFANAMTDTFFKQQLKITQGLQQSQQVVRPVFLHLFSMTKLKATPQKISDLCITMFPMLGFREKVTEVYIQLYNNDPNFPPSSYTHLSSQLLTSYLSISKLVKEGRMNPLRYQPKCASHDEIQRIAEGYVRYYYDIRYLSKLYGDASFHYWKLHGQRKMFYALGYYRIIFDNFPRSIDYYGLQEIFADRVVSLVHVIQRDQSGLIAQMALRELYQFITTYKTSPHNKYRPQERLFALILFAQLKGDLSSLDDEQTMKDLWGQLGVQDFRIEGFQLITNICSVLKTASELIQNNNDIAQKYTFYSIYLKKSQFLFNLDAILLKIVLKMCQYHRRSDPSFDYKLLLLYSPDKTLYFHIDNQLEFDEDPANLIKMVCSLKNYVNLVLEAIFSDLPLLAISCALQSMENEIIKIHKVPRIQNTELALYYYECLLRSEDVGRVAIKQFKATAELFFKEESAFRTFVERHRDPLDQLKLMKLQDQGPQINCIYFQSLCSIPSEKYQNSNCFPAYMKWKKDQQVDVFIDRLADAINLFLKKAYSSQNSNSEFFKGKIIPYLIVEMWKITLFSQSEYSIKAFQAQLQKVEVEQEIQNLGKTMLSAIHRQEYHSSEDLQQKRKLQLKKKLQDKKALIKQQMNKNAEKVLQNESSKGSELSEAKPEEVETCFLCKEGTSENIYLLGLTTFTSGNGWFCTSKEVNMMIPVFETCGHVVHRSCFVKIIAKDNLNRVYLSCPLCKKSTNILLPEHQGIDAADCESFIDSLRKVYDTLEIKDDDNTLKKGICNSMVFEIIMKGLIFPEEFAKNIKVYRTIYHVFSKILIQHSENWINEMKLTLEHDAPSVFREINTLIVSVLNNLPSDAVLSQKLIDRTCAILDSLKGKEAKECYEESPEIQQLRQSIVFPSIQQGLSALNSKYRGKCIECELVTNDQMICLSCPSFVACLNCKKMKLMDHSRIHHASSAVFLKTSTGQPFYIMRNRHWKFESLYEDYMGRAYESSSKHRENYKLNKGRFEEVKRDILMMRIEQKVRSKQLQTNRVFNDEIN